MSKRFGGVLRVGLSKSGVTLLQTSGWLRLQRQVLAECALSKEESSSPELIAAKLRSLLDAAYGARLPVRVVLSDDWVRRWMVTPPQNATRLADCMSAAAARFQALFGEAPSDWQLTADWDTRRPFLACAMPLWLLAVLRQVAREYRLVLLEVAPQFVVAWNRWRAQLTEVAWFGVIHGKVLTLAAPSQRGLGAVHGVTLPDEVLHDQSRLPQIVAREALRLNLAMPSEIRLCGQIPAHWVMQEIDSLAFARLDQPWLYDALPLSAGMSLAVTGLPS